MKKSSSSRLLASSLLLPLFQSPSPRVLSSIRLLASSILLLVLASCATIKPEKPAENYSGAEISLKPSNINIPLDINISDLEAAINSQFKGLIYEDNNMKVSGLENLALKVWKKDNFTLSMNENQISYTAPLKLWMKASYFIGGFGIGVTDSKELNADIALKFKTAITLNPDWTITTNTMPDGYEWLSSPVLKIGPVDLPIKFIADQVLKSNLKTLSTAIDKGIKTNLDIKKYALDAWTAVQKPVKVNEAYNVWVRITPQEITTTPLVARGGKIKHTLGVKSVTEAFIGQEPPYLPNDKLPNLKIQTQLEDDFLVNLFADISFTKVNELAKQYLNGKTFQQGKYALLINDIDLFGSEDKLIIHLNVSGSLKGNLYFSGKPYYNQDKQAIQIRDLDFELKTRNILLKTGSWLLHGTLANMVQSNLSFPLGDQLKSAQAMIQENIKEYKLTTSVVLSGQVSDLNIGDIILSKESIKTGIILKGKLSVFLKK